MNKTKQIIEIDKVDLSLLNKHLKGNCKLSYKGYKNLGYGIATLNEDSNSIPEKCEIIRDFRTLVKNFGRMNRMRFYAGK